MSGIGIRWWRGALAIGCAAVLAAGCSVIAQTPESVPADFVPGEGKEVDVDFYGVVPQSADQAQSITPAPGRAQLGPSELCRTEEGRRIILNNEDPASRHDQEMQWQGDRANGFTDAATFDDYRLERVATLCAEGQVHQFPWGIPVPLGTCNAVRFGPPHYDVQGTISRVRAAKQYYETSNDPWVGSNGQERAENLKRVIAGDLAGIAANLKFAYMHTRCDVGNTGRCAASTGEKRICERVYIDAPPYQVLVRDSLSGGQHVKEGPVLEGPTRAWFRVGKTGHGENWGTATAQSKFDDVGASRKTELDMDALRRALIKAGLPVDRQPAPIATSPGTGTPSTNPTPRPPARISITKVRRNNFYDVSVLNEGGSEGAVSFIVCYLDGFFEASPAKWKEKARRGFVLQPGQSRNETFHDFHAKGWAIWRPASLGCP